MGADIEFYRTKDPADGACLASFGLGHDSVGPLEAALRLSGYGCTYDDDCEISGYLTLAGLMQAARSFYNLTSADELCHSGDAFTVAKLLYIAIVMLRGYNAYDDGDIPFIFGDGWPDTGDPIGRVYFELTT